MDIPGLRIYIASTDSLSNTSDTNFSYPLFVLSACCDILTLSSLLLFFSMHWYSPLSKLKAHRKTVIPLSINALI